MFGIFTLQSTCGSDAAKLQNQQQVCDGEGGNQDRSERWPDQPLRARPFRLKRREDVDEDNDRHGQRKKEGSKMTN
jgi:hypothetical protein